MNFHERLFESIAALAALILCAALLKRLRILSTDHSALFAKFVVYITLPALIFTTLSRHPVTLNQIYLAGTMMAAEIACMLLAMGACKLLKLSRAKTGAVVLTATFGSSAFLGYAIVMVTLILSIISILSIVALLG